MAASRRTTIHKQTGLGFFVIFGSVFIVAGLAVGLWFFLVLASWYETRSWPEVPCVVKSSDVRAVTSSSGKMNRKSTRYEVQATYEYRYGGRAFTSSQVKFSSGDKKLGGNDQELGAELSAARRSGKPYRCYVNPHKPEEAVLVRGLHWPMLLLLGLFPLLFPLIGAGVMASGVADTLRTRRERTNREALPGEPWRWRSGWEQEWIPPRSLVGPWFWLGAAVWTALVILPLAFAIWESSDWNFADLPAWVALLLFLVWGLIARSALKRLVSRWGGGVLLFVNPRPVVPGRRAEAVVALPPFLAGSTRGKLEVQIRCVRELRMKHGSSTTQNMEPVWVHAIHAPMSEALREGSKMKVTVPLEIPAGQPADEPESLRAVGWEQGMRLIWTLEVRSARLKAPVVFDLPVFASGPGQESVEPEKLAQGARGTTSAALTSPSGIEAYLKEHHIESQWDERGLPFSFTCLPERFKALRTFLGWFNGFWTAVLVILIVVRVPFVFPLIWGAAAAGMWYWFVISMERRELLLDGTRMQITRKLLGKATQENLEKRHVVRFTQDTNTSSGSTHYYRVRVENIFGKTQTLLDGFTSSQVAQELVNVLERWRKEA